jgi:diadenosine tetraphosphatase ApaH/serine/threonine PP2A family protein phosphatase
MASKGASGNWESVRQETQNAEVISEDKVVTILLKLMEILYKETNVLQLHSPITICGDIHGQLDDLLELFNTAGGIKDQTFLFMGDYVDRGWFSMNTFLYLATLKIENPTQFYLLRGNHETRQVTQMYGFLQETLLNYGHSGIWTLANEVFDLLPMAAVVDKYIFAVHGGISPDFPYYQMISSHNRQDELPPKGGLADLCWSDPEDVQDWRPNMRGAGTAFGAKQVSKFLHENKLNLITRSHQLAKDGYAWKFPALEQKSGLTGALITVWSAPNYMYTSGNMASILRYGYWDGPNRVDLKIFGPNKKRLTIKNPAVAGHYFA